MKTNNFTSSLPAIDNSGRIVHVAGYRKKEKDINVSNLPAKVVRKGVQEHTILATKQYIHSLTLCVTIKHKDDVFDAEIATANLLKRYKSGYHHLVIRSPQYLADDLCKAIVENECGYIAANLDYYLKSGKLKRVSKHK